MKEIDYKLTQKLTIKDIAILNECSESTAKRIKKLICIEFNIKVVLYCHYRKFYMMDEI